MNDVLQTLLTQEIRLTTEDGQPFEIPPEGSLGLLALGYQGLAAWRQAREKRQPTPGPGRGRHPYGES